MKVIKGFITIASLVSNQPNTVAKLGELSPFSYSFSKEKADYQLDIAPDYRLTTFKCIEAVTNVNTVLEDSKVKIVFDLIKEAIIYAKSHTRPYDSEDFRNTLLTELTGRIKDLQFGAYVDNGTMSLPEWFSWSDVADDSYFKIWLADESFRDQYDEYEIIVIPPFTPIDDFFNSYANVKAKLESITLSSFNNLLEVARGDEPESYTRFLSYKYVNPNFPDQKVASSWCVLIYGKAGDNIDAIKDAIIAYILANSSHPRGTWETLIPEIFKRTEFMLVPRWDKISVPNLTVMSGLYNSMLEPIECLDFVKTLVPFYSAAFIDYNTYIFPYDYKGISIIAVNGPDNLEGKEKLNLMFKDYIPVDTSSLDFNRMEQKTRDWVLFIETLLIAAEKATMYSNVSGSLRRITRDNIVYISGTFDDANYIMACKLNSQFQG